MRRSDFHFDLPEQLIAQRPLERRDRSRLLLLGRRDDTLADRRFAELDQLLNPGDLLVFNDTRVVKARLLGRKDSGGRVELLIERLLDEQRALAQARASKAPRKGSRIVIGETAVTVLDRQADGFYLLGNEAPGFSRLMQDHGHVPLPPYIRRADEAADESRYQTVYARSPGAVAAPTAGLHFDQPLLERLSGKGVEQGFLTLHVGAGTFQSMRVEQLEQHRMHAERVVVGERLCRQVAAARKRGSRVVAVGTTTLRSLEAAFRNGAVRPFEGDTDLFLYPGKEIHSSDALITNFHLPESTLLMLVCAFAGTGRTLAAYRHAVAQSYRFFSYGDAMLIR